MMCGRSYFAYACCNQVTDRRLSISAKLLGGETREPGNTPQSAWAERMMLLAKCRAASLYLSAPVSFTIALHVVCASPVRPLKKAPCSLVATCTIGVSPLDG